MVFEVALALVLTVAAIVGLAALDPKRNRTLRVRTGFRIVRPVLLLLALTPGVLLLVQARSATFVVWIGLASIVGWLLANLLGERSVE